MKRLKPNQIGPWCSYCEPVKVRATHRQDGFIGKFCCDNHIDNLKSDEHKEHQMNNRYTEADHSTWGQL